MKKLLLLLWTVVATYAYAWSQTTETLTTNNFFPGTSGYGVTKTSTNKCLDVAWTIYGFNNNSNSSTWGDIRCGNKNSANDGYVATITSAAAINKVITKIVVKTSFIKSGTNDKLKSAPQLLISENSNFANAATYALPSYSAQGDWEFLVPQESIGANKFYKLEFPLLKASNNGWLSIKSIDFYISTQDDNKTEVALAFDPTSNSLPLGGTFTAPNFTKSAADAVVNFTVDGDEGVLSLEADGTIKSSLDKVGTATVIASIADNDPTYYATPATYTLEVYDPTAPRPIFESAMGTEFTFENPDGLEIWKHDTTYGLKGTAYISGTSHACEGAIAASDLIDLSKYKNVTLNFSTAFNNYKKNNVMIDPADFSGYAYVVVKEEGATEWVEVCEATAPTTFGWDFYKNDPVDLSAYDNQKIQIGFKYVSTAEVAGTWEVKNITVEGVEGQGKTPAGLSFGDITTATGVEGETITVNYLNPNLLPTMRQSSDIEVVSITESGPASEDGREQYIKLKLRKPGTATITVTSEETETFKAGKASFTITVTEKPKTPVTMTFSTEQVEGYVDTMTETVPVLTTDPEGLEVTYTSSDTEVVEVADDGSFLMFNKVGTATITAKFSGNEQYNSNSASYTVTVLPGLGDITVNGKTVTKNETVTVYAGTTVVFAAENATSVSAIYEDENGDVYEIAPAAGSIEWPATLGQYAFVVTAELASLPEKDITFTISVEEAPEVSTTTLTATNLGIEGTTYTDYVAEIDGITFAGCLGGAYPSGVTQSGPAHYVSIRNSNSSGNYGGIAVTVNEDKVCTGVKITQSPSQSTARKAYVYGSYEAYETGKGINTANISTGSVKLGEASMQTGTSVTIPFDDKTPYYPYIIILSDGALQMSQIDIEWEKRFEMPMIEFEHTGKLSDGGMVTFTMSHSKAAKARIFYVHEPEVAPAAVGPKREHSLTSDKWKELSFDDNTVLITEKGLFNAYASDATGRNRSLVNAAKVEDDKTTGIAEISAGSAETEVFDLQGRRIANPAKGGVYILKQGSKVSKRVL